MVNDAPFSYPQHYKNKQKNRTICIQNSSFSLLILYSYKAYENMIYVFCSSIISYSHRAKFPCIYLYYTQNPNNKNPDWFDMMDLGGNGNWKRQNQEELGLLRIIIQTLLEILNSQVLQILQGYHVEKDLENRI
ncbi:hypothetical protein TTHERM_001018311 (macronuclear) [Tetrahymena thermophila SB210]|uniref:Uncharacterized protein n=1 Tax=Tetrahymena thermophila (strain SB210) TaxID=312017 RepID=W7XL86_TETTS|nr:hypothetical protein TTHERM_001018311 [Tetrahymena thermophila SB210]EWS75854.1 hypothetical protein TTHERM_001018311 [Tetrahymena thermophila SB210]|eukprot:XP_012651610.1 hypothetical protein TTHERM_001018311 [Tetrahymena thermophila SB210]